MTDETVRRLQCSRRGVHRGGEHRRRGGPRWTSSSSSADRVPRRRCRGDGRRLSLVDRHERDACATGRVSSSLRSLSEHVARRDLRAAQLGGPAASPPSRTPPRSPAAIRAQSKSTASRRARPGPGAPAAARVGEHRADRAGERRDVAGRERHARSPRRPPPRPARPPSTPPAAPRPPPPPARRSRTARSGWAAPPRRPPRAVAASSSSGRWPRKSTLRRTRCARAVSTSIGTAEPVPATASRAPGCARRMRGRAAMRSCIPFSYSSLPREQQRRAERGAGWRSRGPRRTRQRPRRDPVVQPR